MRFGLAEALVLPLLLATMFFGVRTIASQGAAAGFRAAQASVAGLRWDSRGGRAGARAILVDYTYSVDGVLYTGYAQELWLQRGLFAALPQGALERLAARGYLRFEDLPPAVLEVLRKKGVESFERIPAKLFATVYQLGYRTLHDLPQEWLAAARGGDYNFVANKLDRLLPDAGAAYPIGFGTTTGDTETGAAQFNTTRTPASGYGFLTVYYDPAHPALHRLVALPGAPVAYNALLSLLFAAAALAYAAFGYPRLKQRIRQTSPEWMLRWN
jgi:hypothetical protein